VPYKTFCNRVLDSIVTAVFRGDFLNSNKIIWQKLKVIAGFVQNRLFNI